MKIKESVQQEMIGPLRGKYKEIADQVKLLADGYALPVEFDSEGETRKALSGIRSALHGDCVIRRSDKTLYIWNLKRQR